MLELCIDFFKSIHWHCLSEPVDRVRVMGIQGTKNAIFLKKCDGNLKRCHERQTLIFHLYYYCHTVISHLREKYIAP